MILVTGSTGFIGSHLCDLLEYHQIPYKRFEGDVTKVEDVERNLRDVETVVHLAAVTYAPVFFDIPTETLNVNLMGTLNFLRNHKLFDRFIFVSSSHAYGKQENFPIKEDAIPNPIEPYSVGKMATEHLVRCYAEAFNFDYTILRPFNNYGPRQSHKFLVPTLIKQALLEKKITVKGNSVRDFVYVGDTVEAMLKVIEAGTLKHRVYNICSGKAVNIEEVGEKIWSIVRNPSNPIELQIQEMTDRVVDIPYLVGSFDRIYYDVGWEPKWTLENGLLETVDYWRDRLEDSTREH